MRRLLRCVGGGRMISEFITPIVITSLAAVLGSLITLIFTLLKQRRRGELLELRDETHHITMNKDSAGLVEAIFIGERSMLCQMASDLLSKERRSVDIFGLALGWIEYTGLSEELTSAAKRGVNIRILLIHPEFARLREAQEAQNSGSIGQEVLKTLHHLIAIRQLTGGDIQIRLFKGLPCGTIVATSDTMLFQPYAASSLAQNSPVMVFKSGGELFARLYHDMFLQSWNYAELTTSLSPEDDSASAQLCDMESKVLHDDSRTKTANKAMDGDEK